MFSQRSLRVLLSRRKYWGRLFFGSSTDEVLGFHLDTVHARGCVLLVHLLILLILLLLILLLLLLLLLLPSTATTITLLSPAEEKSHTFLASHTQVLLGERYDSYKTHNLDMSSC